MYVVLGADYRFTVVLADVDTNQHSYPTPNTAKLPKLSVNSSIQLIVRTAFCYNCTILYNCNGNSLCLPPITLEPFFYAFFEGVGDEIHLFERAGVAKKPDWIDGPGIKNQDIKISRSGPRPPRSGHYPLPYRASTTDR